LSHRRLPSEPSLTPALSAQIPRRELRSRYPSKPWVDVFSKSDMLEAELGRAGSYREQLLQQQRQQQQQQDAEQQQQVEGHAALLQQQQQEQQQQQGAGELWGPSQDGTRGQLYPVPSLEDVGEVVGDPSEVAARLPHALHVSSLTQHGVPELQAVIVDLFTAQAQAAAQAAVAAALEAEGEAAEVIMLD